LQTSLICKLKLREGDLTLLTDEKRAEFIPMAYRFMEAAKEGEYEHNLSLALHVKAVGRR